jgi:epoxide hydrolase
MRPFAIEVPDAVLDDLRDRLRRTRWPEPVAGAHLGVDLDELRELCAYWADGYDWRAWEARLNELPGFLCEVGGLDLHLWHVRGAGPSPTPLLLLHGWPGSMFEFLELVQPLAADGFDVVVPALPGFGFGGRPREPGWGVGRIAEAFHTLMTRELGYERYLVQGGDWGGIIAAQLASEHPEQVPAIHVNFVVVPPPERPGPEDAEALERLKVWRRAQSAYLRVQSTEPDALTVAQGDSPAGLAAWIAPRFTTWSDRRVDRDVLLTNLMFYWAPNSTASSARIYHETAREPGGLNARRRVEVPVAYAAFPHELVRPPRHWVEPHYAIARWTDMPRGGHFAALEEPGLLLEDVRAFFATQRRLG